MGKIFRRSGLEQGIGKTQWCFICLETKQQLKFSKARNSVPRLVTLLKIDEKFSPFCPPGHSEEKAKTLFFGLSLLTSFKVIFPSYLGCVSLLSFCTYFYFVAIIHRHYLSITRKPYGHRWMCIEGIPLYFQLRRNKQFLVQVEELKRH